MKTYIAIIAIAAASTFSSAQATELLLTSSMSKTKEARSVKGVSDSIALDFVSDGNTVGLQFNIPLPKGSKPEQVNIKSCVADVPAMYFSHCNIAKGHIIVQVANDEGSPIPAGVFPVGKIELIGMTAQDLGKINFIAADKNAEAIQSAVRVVN